MKEKIKLLMPFIFIGATVSCGQSGSNLKLKRETYDEKIEAATIFAEYVAPLKEKQKKDEVYQISDQGMVISNVSYNLKAEKVFCSYFEESYDPENELGAIQPKILVDLTDANETYNDKIVISWDVNKNYFKFDGKKKGVYYVTKDEDGVWWQCNNLFDERQGRWDITEEVEDFGDFHNYIFNAVTERLSTPYGEGEGLLAGFDLSGFIGLKSPLGTVSSAYVGPYSQNILSPMSLLTYTQGEQSLNVSNYIDLASILLQSMGYDFCFNASQDIVNNAYSEEIGTGNIDLVDIKDLYNSETVQAVLKFLQDQQFITVNLSESTGKANLDFFLNYKDNFVHQEEILAELKDINFDLSGGKTDKSGNIQYLVDCEIKKTNLNAVGNMETSNTCSVDSINLEDYLILG